MKSTTLWIALLVVMAISNTLTQGQDTEIDDGDENDQLDIGKRVEKLTMYYMLVHYLIIAVVYG